MKPAATYSLVNTLARLATTTIDSLHCWFALIPTEPKFNLNASSLSSKATIFLEVVCQKLLNRQSVARLKHNKNSIFKTQTLYCIHEISH